GDSKAITVSYSSIGEGLDGIEDSDNGVVNWLNGNITNDPRFVDDSQAIFSLLASSQCINAGHPDSIDSDGSRADMGAFPFLNEYSGPDWHVSVDGDNISGTGELANPFASIQAGINFASSSDSVLVGPGTYYDNLDFRGRAITVRGSEGSQNTIVDGNGLASVVQFENSEINTSKLIGFTITNGNAHTGGGIYIRFASPILEDLRVTNNVAGYQGGGIYAEYSNPIIYNCIVSNNQCPNLGGGLMLFGSRAEVGNTEISQNFAGSGGGGVSIGNSPSPILTNVLITNNSATYHGAGVFLYLWATPSIINSTITDNFCSSGGGGVSIRESSTSIVNSILFNNEPQELYFLVGEDTSSVEVTHSLVEGGFEGVELIDESYISWESGNIDSDPHFLSSTSSNYSLSDYSPCLGAGLDTLIVPVVDFAGNPRPNPAGTNPDIGAYESSLAEPIVVVEVQNLHIGDSEEILHLISHNPQITYSYYNSLEEPLGFHQIQVSSLSDFSLIDKWDTYTVINPDTVVTYAGNALVDGETYYLRVKAGSGDIWTDWETLSFRMNSIPEAPGLVSPIANTVIGEDLLFTVENSNDSEEDEVLYQFFLFEDVAMSALVDSSELVAEGVDYTMWLSEVELLDNNQYWWTSRVFDGYEYSSLSAPASFLVNTENAAPETFELLFPTPEIVISTLTPTFSWHSSLDVDPEDIVSYSLHLDTPEPGVLIFELGSDTLFFPPEPLLDNTVYYWRVVAKDLLGFETESLGGYRSFVINLSNDNPSVVDLITPDSVMVLSLTPEMFWTRATDIDPGDMVTYEMHWWGDGIEYDSVLTDTNGVVLPRELQDNMQYFWEVIAMDQSDGISHSEPATFWTDLVPEAPEGFALLSPENDAAGLSNMPSFQWEMADDPDPMDYVTYTLQIASDSSFSEVVFETNTNVEVGHELIEALPTETEYWWRVVATDADSLTTESEVFKFTVGYVSIVEEIALPTEFMLDQNYPNPFNPSTTIRYGLPEESNVSLVIYDVRGQVVQTIASEHQSAGWYNVVWNGGATDGKTISTGIYFARLVAGDYSQVVKMLYLK
ncbi:MAG: T9SS type A sorting domain-containing protein, partial [Candidatus Marinimicrobia bacterium]|nr:T9SS type A sorting domain-containing protein [Candidatus Neomarinimicrobiota bacterium]